MKIKIAYGVDMRLWKHAPFDDKPQSQTYQDLITYITKTFEFKDTNDFLIKFKDDDDELTTISSLEDFQEAFISYKEQEKKSLKLHIHDKASNNKNNTIPSQQKQQQAPNEADEEEKKSVAPDNNNNTLNQHQPPIESRYASSEKQQNSNPSNSNEPSPEEINAFLSDDFVIDLLSDLFIAVFEALEESQFEISFIECVQGIILSDDGKYDKLTSNKIWPYFCDQLLPKYSSKIEMFVIPMIRNNGINSQMIKQWIPTMLNMMKMHQQRRMDNNNFNGFGAGFGGFPWRGMHGMHNGPPNRARGGHRGGHNWRGRGWRNNHHGNGHGYGYNNHHGHGHGRRGGRRGWRGHHGHGRGYGHGHGHGHNAWFNQENNNGSQDVAPSAPMEGVNDENEQMEQEEFEYTEELAAIMSMGFNNIGLIKKLLIEHKGNKQNVVQELVSNSSKN